MYYDQVRFSQGMQDWINVWKLWFNSPSRIKEKKIYSIIAKDWKEFNTYNTSRILGIEESFFNFIGKI
jgi:hypothetical protein